jgi:hypothetical protein
VAARSRWRACAAAMTAARTSGSAPSGEPAAKGGAGSYSMASWIASAVLGPAISAATESATSMPAVTPPPVTILPSMTTRSAAGSAPKGRNNSRDIQCVAARLPRNSPAAPRTSAPVHTLTT